MNTLRRLWLCLSRSEAAERRSGDARERRGDSLPQDAAGRGTAHHLAARAISALQENPRTRTSHTANRGRSIRPFTAAFLLQCFNTVGSVAGRGIRAVKNLVPAHGGPDITWKYLWQMRLVRQKPEVLMFVVVVV